ncbi:hypothetical protein BHM03_00058750 [Ensete ventricosum]|uniref:Uncharacterized protein n=1 Tax=Ensete ventricosum TaxID=4639 RepID=A0A445MMK9_ENSVE|nr:hypothetical protein BHM03_00058750 [Ensete ventricosum]
MRSCYVFTTKATRRRGGQPRPTPMQGQLPTTRLAARGSRLWPRPLARGQSTTAKAPCRGSRQHARPPMGMAGPCGRRQRLRPCRKQQSPATTPQGAVGYPLRGRKGQPRGQGCRLQGWPLLQGQRPRKATPPAREVPLDGNSACSRRWRAAPPPAQGNDDGATQ